MRPEDYWLQRHDKWRWTIARWVDRRGWVVIFDGSERQAKHRLRKILEQLRE